MKRILCSLVVIASLSRPVAARLENRLPAGLTLADWRQIRAEYIRHRHTAFPDGSALKSRNRTQRWNVIHDGRGFTIEPDQKKWRWGLEFAAQQTPSVTVDKNRVTYTWGPAIEEWFVNEPRGLEHGFTIRQKAGPIDLRLKIRGDLRAHTRGDAILFADSSGSPAIAYSHLRAWDATGRALPARMEAAQGTVRLSVDDRGARYPVTIDPLVQNAYLKPAAVGTTQAGDMFGVSIAIDGDTVAVGATIEDGSARVVNGPIDEASPNSGAVYVFVRANGVWTQQAYVKPATVGTTSANDLFGNSVGVSGDTLVVGAPFEDSNSTGVNLPVNENALDSGAAYVFVRNNGIWVQQAYLKPTNVGTTQAGDNFGGAVAISGDTIVVGAQFEDSSTAGVNVFPNEAAPNSGAAFVFFRTNGLWAQNAYLKSSAPGPDQFGYSVAIDGDTVAVGAIAEDSASLGVNSAPNEAANNAGAVFVFTRSSGVWSQQAYLKPAAVGVTQAGDSFGWSVAISRDTILVGAPGEDSASLGVNSTPSENAVNSGAAYVFVRTAGVWSQQGYLKPAAVGTTQAADGFGYGVALSGDLAAVGAYLEDSSNQGVNGTPNEAASNAGAVYLFTRSGGTWTKDAYLKPTNVGTTQAGDTFGNKVAISGNTVAISAPGEESSSLGVNSTPDEASVNAGAAYIFEQAGPTISEVLDAGSLKPEISAHSWVVIKGAGLASTTRTWGDVDYAGSPLPFTMGLDSTIRIWGGADLAGNPLPFTLDGVSVTLDGLPAAVYYISPLQVSVLAGALTRTGPVEVIVTTPAGRNSFTATVQAEVPAWFTLNAEGNRYVAALNADGVVVGKPDLYPSAPNYTKPLPAKASGLIYGTGWGPTSPAVPEGVAFSGDYTLVNTASITIGGVPVDISFAGIVSPGLYQFKVIAPDLPPGDHLIAGAINGRNTQEGVYITLGAPE